MLKEGWTFDDATPKESVLPLSDIKIFASDLVKQMLKKTHVQKTLHYSSATMDQIFPVAISYYLFWKAHSVLPRKGKVSEETEVLANRYVAAAMQVYPDILDEIAVGHSYQKPLDTTNPHDVAIYLGVRLAQLESSEADEMTRLRNLQADVKEISQATMQEQAA